MSSVKFINKDNLRIARKNVGLTTLSASKIVSTSKKDLVADWENGKSLPTWPQIKKLSKSYNIPELLFFSNVMIEENKAIPDYRVGLGNEGDEKVKKLINLVISRQKWLEKKFKEEKLSKNKTQGSGRDIGGPDKLASFIAQKLDINIEDIKNIKGGNSAKAALDYLIEKAERHGIFVGKTISYHRLDVEDVRGLFISNDYCPFIILNRRDALVAQIFSFIHELAHLFRKSDSISNSLDFRTTSNKTNREEKFCNRVAAEFLLPASDFVNEFYSKLDIKKIATIYKASEIFVFYRLVDLGKIRRSEQNVLEKEILEEMNKNLAAKLEREKDQDNTGGNYYNSMRDSNGDLFNRFVSSSYFENKIGYVEASNLLLFSVEMV